MCLNIYLVCRYQIQFFFFQNALYSNMISGKKKKTVFKYEFLVPFSHPWSKHLFWRMRINLLIFWIRRWELPESVGVWGVLHLLLFFLGQNWQKVCHILNPPLWILQSRDFRQICCSLFLRCLIQLCKACDRLLGWGRESVSHYQTTLVQHSESWRHLTSWHPIKYFLNVCCLLWTSDSLTDFLFPGRVSLHYLEHPSLWKVSFNMNWKVVRPS